MQKRAMQKRARSKRVLRRAHKKKASGHKSSARSFTIDRLRSLDLNEHDQQRKQHQ